MGPEIRYARSGDVHIAYQVVGDGPFDLVHIPGFVSHLECAWEEPELARYYERLASFSRLILFDKRGTGLSDRVSVATMDERMDDIRAVMDAAGSERAAIFGVSEGGPLGVLFAATHPERTLALVIYGTAAACFWGDSAAPMPPAYRLTFDNLEHDWGRPDSPGLCAQAPSKANAPRFYEWLARQYRMGASPGAASTLMRMYGEIDVRAAAEALRVPTLLLHRVGDMMCSVNHGRGFAARIPGVKYVELPGEDHIWHAGDTETLLREVKDFLVRVSPAPEPHSVLATVLCAEIVEFEGAGPTSASTVDALRSSIARFRGREARHMGNGLLATFDGPARAVRCARVMRDAVRHSGFELHIGLHTGECEMLDDGVGGPAPRVAACLQAMAGPGEILASSTVRELVVASDVGFSARGTHQFDGIPGQWRVFAVGDEAHDQRRRGGHARIHHPDGLSGREVEILRLLAQGKRNREIAAALVISTATVTRHVSNILRKTGLSNRTELASYAVARGLLEV